MPEALSLTAACRWLFNSLQSRVDDGPASRRLMDCVLPVAEAADLTPDVLAYNTSLRAPWEQEDDDEPVVIAPRQRIPYNANGLIFLRRMMLSPVPRLRVGGPILPAKAFQYWFEGSTLEDIKLKYQNSGIVSAAAVRSGRSTTNKRKMIEYVNWTGAPEPDLFDLGAQGFTLPSPEHDSGSDIEDRETPEPEDITTLDSWLSGLWRQFIVDVTSKSPNPQGSTKPSYLKLKTIQRRIPDDSHFRSMNFPALFTDVLFRPAPTSDWKRAFKWLFPEPGTTIRSDAQSYPSCVYFKKWMAFVNTNAEKNPALVKTARKEIWLRLKTWEWIPDAQQDKMWPTSTVNGFTRWPAKKNRSGKNAAAPRILYKKNGHPDLTVPETDVDEMDVDEDEEDEGDEEEV